MRKFLILINIAAILSVLTIALSISSCKKTENPINFPLGIFPDSVINLEEINSIYDDYNSSIYQINGYTSLVFSSNRETFGEKFDFVQSAISFMFNQTTGEFQLATGIIEDTFISMLIYAANTAGDDLGPFRLYSKTDGYEYFVYSSENTEGNLDYFYLKNLPLFGSALSEVEGPYPVNRLNTSSNDAYLCLNSTQDTVYFSSDINGSFDIFFQERPADTRISSWFDLSYSSSTLVDNINSDFNDKCPFVQKNLMIFASDREGGMGGYDLYYSILENGSWSSPVNLGPKVNTEYNEYRPIIGYHAEFSNLFMIFSSDRPGGKGNYDLYFSGLYLPE